MKILKGIRGARRQNAAKSKERTGELQPLAWKGKIQLH
jgi:hypothetical protein